MNYYEIGQKIRRFRKAHGLSQEELAERVGISVTHMSHIETGNTKLSLPVFVELAAVLEVRTDELLFDGETVSHSIVVESIAANLEDCSIHELRILEDLLRAAKLSLRKNINI